MEITEIQVDGYEKVMRCRDAESGLHALIAVHDTTLGPALGGMRMLPYASEDEALFDVLRLSRGMTYKSATADTGLGGGKSVILGDPKHDKSPALFRSMGRFVDSLDGLYITAEDMNIGIPYDEEYAFIRACSRICGNFDSASERTGRVRPNEIQDHEGESAAGSRGRLGQHSDPDHAACSLEYSYRCRPRYRIHERNGPRHCRQRERAG
jgi:hypothetical protein